MSDTFTTALRLRKQETGANEDSWGDLLNETIVCLDDAIAGAVSVDVTSGSATLTQSDGASDQARMFFVMVTGSPSVARQITLQDAEKVYVVCNLTDVSITLRRPAGGTTLVLGAQQSAMVYLSSAGVFGVGFDGDAVTAGDTLTRVTANINGATVGGDQTTVVDYVVQGRFAFVNIRNFSCQITTTALTFGIKPTADWPTEIVPAQAVATPVIMCTGSLAPTTNVVPAYLTIATSASSLWDFARVSATSWSGTTDKCRAAFHNISFCYPLGA